MDKKVLNYVTEKTHSLINSGMVCKEAKEEAKKWLAALGTENEKKETVAYIKELEEDILPIDKLLEFLNSPLGEQIIGKDHVKDSLSHAIERKNDGEKFCDCPACTACAEILTYKENMLKW